MCEQRKLIRYNQLKLVVLADDTRGKAAELKSGPLRSNVTANEGTHTVDSRWRLVPAHGSYGTESTPRTSG